MRPAPKNEKLTMMGNLFARHPMRATAAPSQPEANRVVISEASDERDNAPLIVHIIFRLAAGGLENGLVNLVNRLPSGRFRHAIICLRDFTDFRVRITHDDVAVYALNKADGKQLGLYFRLWALLRRLKPQIVHTRNLGTLDCVVPAALAGVPHRIHGEHGWDMVDLHGTSYKYRLLRRATSPLIEQFVTVSQDLAAWLHREVRIPGSKIEYICNGVDTDKFKPGLVDTPLGAPPFLTAPDTVVVGTVGRMEAVKDQLTLARAFLYLLDSVQNARSRLRLVMIGDGTLRSQVQMLLDRADATSLVWLPGERNDIAPILRCMDIFVLPSLNEGISNTILEAMATGLPVVATRVGGNPELVDDGRTGMLVEPGNPQEMARILEAYVSDIELRTRHARAARARAEHEFSLEVMIARYSALYSGVLGEQASMNPGV